VCLPDAKAARAARDTGPVLRVISAAHAGVAGLDFCPERTAQTVATPRHEACYSSMVSCRLSAKSQIITVNRQESLTLLRKPIRKQTFPYDERHETSSQRPNPCGAQRRLPQPDRLEARQEEQR
jgi:hypothetical protein